MTLQFILGTSDKDHEAVLVDEAVNWLARDPKHQVFYLVPNSIKFEQELSVLKRISQLNGSDQAMMSAMRLQVFSFYRLAWYYLQHTEYYSSEVLSEAGAAMILRRILKENQEKLTVFRGEINKPGFIKQLIELVTELKEGNIHPDDLEQITTQLGTEDATVNMKLQELQLIFSQYDEALAMYNLKSAEIIHSLGEYLSDQDLSQVQFIVTGYSRLSAREAKLINLLMEKSSVKIALILDRPYIQEAPSTLELFYQSGNLYHTIYQQARQNRIQIAPDLFAPTNETLNTDLKTVGQFWRESQRLTPPANLQLPATTSALQVWQAETAYLEIHAVASEIRRLVAEEQYRYRDIQVLSRDLATYQQLITPIFKWHDIPLHLDAEAEMVHHPLIEFLQSLFAIEERHYRYKDVMRFLRTELFIPNVGSSTEIAVWEKARNHFRNQVDLTENVVLAYGYEGSDWTKEDDWTFVTFDYEAAEKTVETHQRTEAQSNEIRRLVRDHLPNFFKKMKKAQTGHRAASIFYEFLLEAGVETQLLMWRDQATAAGRLEEGRNQEQTWDALMQLLDEYVVIFGEEDFSWPDFCEIFSSGLEDLTYGKIPATIDQVEVTGFDLVRAAQAKVIFTIGLTDQVLPKKIENKSILSDEERDLLMNNLADDQYLTNGTRQDTAREPFVAYLLLASATDRLYLSYPSSLDSKNQKISPYIDRLVQGLGLQLCVQQAVSITDNDQTALRHISTFRTLISDLNALKRQRKELEPPQGVLWDFWERALMKSTYATLAKNVFESLNHQNIPEQLTEENALSLYGKEIYTSVSQMESFYRCQYQYYVNYGLRLKERDIFKLTPAATGDFFHEALDRFFKTLVNEQRALTELTEADLAAFTEKVLVEVFGEARFGILNRSSRMNYIRYQLSETIKRVSWALQEQSRRSGMTTIQTEVLFGQIAQQKGLEGLTFPLQNQGQLTIRGKIDRVDQLQLADATYLGVIDYKSSARRFNITEAYYGLAMQMLTYLDVALMNAAQLTGAAAEEIRPAGSFYLHVKNPSLKYSVEQDLSQELLKEFKFNGLVLNDQELIDHLDHTLEPKESSLVYPIQESAKGERKPGSWQKEQFVTEPELTALLKHNRSKFVEAGNKILSGKIELNPAYEGKERIACRYCPFRSVCTFDVMLKENNYSRIEKLNKEEVFKRILVDQEGEAADE